MKVNFKSDYRDLAEISYQSWQQDFHKDYFFRFFFTYLLLAGIVSIPAFLFAGETYLVGIITFIVTLILSFLFFRPPNRNYFLETCKKFYGEEAFDVEIDVLEEGIKVKQFGDEYFFNWQNFRNLKETENKIFLFTKKGNCISIPLKAFETPYDLGQFMAFTKSKSQPDIFLKDA